MSPINVADSCEGRNLSQLCDRNVVPAEFTLDSRFRGNDGIGKSDSIETRLPCGAGSLSIGMDSADMVIVFQIEILAG